MAKVTLVFAALLIALGLVGFLGTGSTHYTALIPAGSLAENRPVGPGACTQTSGVTPHKDSRIRDLGGRVNVKPPW